MTTPTTRVPNSQAVPLLLALLAAVFAFQLNASMLSPALATMSRELDATDAQIGLTQTAFFTAAALFSLFLPRWGDLIGRRKVLLGMLLATAIGCVVSALAPRGGPPVCWPRDPRRCRPHRPHVPDHAARTRAQ